MDIDKYVAKFVNLFIKTSFFRPVPAVLDEQSAALARTIPGYSDFQIAPGSMIASPPDDNGYAAWKPIPSCVTEKHVIGFELYLQFRLPRIFKSYLCYKCLIDMDLYEGTLPDIIPGKPLSWLEWCVLHGDDIPTESQGRLIPFTLGPAGGSLLCFDNNGSVGQNDCRISMMKYEQTSDTMITHNVFPSCTSYFEFLENWMNYTLTDRSVSFMEWLEQNNMFVPLYVYWE